LFKNILIPLSSEFYPKQVLKRGVFFADKFDSNITLLYIIEEKNLEETDRLVDSYISDYDIAQTKKEMIKTRKQTADNIVFRDAYSLFQSKNIDIKEKILKGEFTPTILKELKKNNHDLILMGFEKECSLKYRLLYNVDIPIWIESQSFSKNILGVCSNLAPNQKVPEFSMKLSKKLGWNLHMLYIVDSEDHVEVDKKGIRSKVKPERDLLFASQNFVTDMEKKGIKIDSVKGNLEKETAKAAEEIGAGLIVMGREKKKKGIFGLPTYNVKQKIACKCKYSILFVN